MMSSRKLGGMPLFKDSLWASLGKAGVILLAFSTNIILTKVLPMDEVGFYFLLINISMFVSLILQFGLPQSIIKHVNILISQKSGFYINSLLKYSLLFISIVGFFISIVLNSDFAAELYLEFNNNEMPDYLAIYITILALLFSYQVFASESFRSIHRVPESMLFGGFFSTLLFLLVMFFGMHYKKLYFDEVVFMHIASLALPVIIGIIIIFKDNNNHSPPVKKFYFFSILSTSSVIFQNNILHFLLSSLDIWMLGYFLTNANVAIYVIYIKIAALISLPLQITFSLTPQKMSLLFDQKKYNELERLLQITSAFLSTASLLIFVSIALFGLSIIEFLFGNDYSQNYLALIIISSAQLLNAVSGPAGMLLNMTGFHKIGLVITIVSLLAMFILGYFLIPLYGITGAASSLAVSLLMYNVLSVLAAKSKVGVRTYASLDSYIQMFNYLGIRKC